MAGSYRLRCPATDKDIGAPVAPDRLKAVKIGPVTGTILEVDHIVEHVTNEHGEVSYRVRWKGQGPEEDTWETKDAFNDPETITEYYRNVSGLPRKRPRGRPRKISVKENGECR